MVNKCSMELDHNFLFLLFYNFSSHLAGVASGATRAALTQHFALQSNAADISAKVPAQWF